MKGSRATAATCVTVSIDGNWSEVQIVGAGGGGKLTSFKQMQTKMNCTARDKELNTIIA